MLVVQVLDKYIMRDSIERFGEVYTCGQDSVRFLQVQDRMGEVEEFDQIVSYRQPLKPTLSWIQIRLNNGQQPVSYKRFIDFTQKRSFRIFDNPEIG